MELQEFLDNFAHYAVEPTLQEIDEVIELLGMGEYHQELIVRSRGEYAATLDLYYFLLDKIMQKKIVPQSELDKMVVMLKEEMEHE